MSDPFDIEGMDQKLAHESEEQEKYEKKHIEEMQFEALIQKACFDSDREQCRCGKCEECPKEDRI